MPDIKSLEKEEPRLLDNKKSNETKASLDSLRSLKNATTGKALTEGFSKVLEENLTGNFQAPDLQKLKGDENQTAFVDIEGIGKIIIDKNIIMDNFPLKGLVELQNNSRVVYIESPVHWKLRNALSRASRSHFSSLKRKSLLVPKYFDDLNFMLMEELSGEIAFPEILKYLTNVIKGKVIINESGALEFKEHGGQTCSLPMTSTGIVQFGILALLIEKKVLDKGTVLFIDEPETNLHPAWQVKMMKVLFQLMKAGVHIIMATHSVDILKWLEIHLKDHTEDKKMIALNQMLIKEDGTIYVVDPTRDIQEKIVAIKKDLTDPFLRLFLKGQE